MVSLPTLWLPILLSGIAVFVVSSVLHMVLPLHRSDYRALPSENEVMESLRRFGIPPGDYMVPRANGMADMKSPAFLDKLARGPVMVVTIMKPGEFSAMGKRLSQWFLYCVIVSYIAAYIASRAAGPGTEWPVVLRFAGCTAFVAYGLGQWQNSIWYSRSWATTIKHNIDALIYGVVTGFIFAWMWPAG